jgi:hypothetical protein
MAIIVTWFAAFGVYKLFTRPHFRKELAGEFFKSPVELPFVLAVCGCFLLFFWGVMIPPFGSIKLWIFGKRVELWAAAGIASVAGFAIMCFYRWLRPPV